MLYGAYQSASGVAQARATQDTIANNLANSETGGFKRLLTLHAQRPLTDPGAADPRFRHATGGSVLLPTRLDLSQGPVEETGNPLDLALVGDGFLQIERNGERSLTRDGRLALDADGTLTLAADPAARVLDADGLPVTLPVGTTPAALHLDDAGTIRLADDGTPLATIGRFAPQNPESLRPVGGGRLAFAGGATATEAVSLRAGYVENSNVDPTIELTRMIEVGRLLEANANMIRHADTTLGKLIDAAAIG